MNLNKTVCRVCCGSTHDEGTNYWGSNNWCSLDCMSIPDPIPALCLFPDLIETAFAAEEAFDVYLDE